MKHLVIGGAGFIGSNLVRNLYSMGESVHVIDNLYSGKIKNIEDLVSKDYIGYNFESISNPICHGIIKSYKPDVVYMLAAKSGVSGSIADPLSYNSVNISSFLNILEYSVKSKVKRFVYSSSSSVYGGDSSFPVSEDSELKPKSPYALQKVMGEQYCRMFSNLYGIETVCLRYFNVFGPNQYLKSYCPSVIPAFLDAYKYSQRPTVHGEGNQFRDFIYVDDVVQAIKLAAFSTKKFFGDAYNVAYGDPYSINDLWKIIGNIEPIYLKKRPGDIIGSHANISKIRKELGYFPKYNLHDGIEITKKWFMDT